MFARKFAPAISASQSRTDAGPYLNPFPSEDAASLATMAPLFAALDLDARIAMLAAQIERHHDRRAEELEEQRNDARREQDDADALADAIDAGDCDEDGEPIPYDTYRSAV